MRSRSCNVENNSFLQYRTRQCKRQTSTRDTVLRPVRAATEESYQSETTSIPPTTSKNPDSQLNTHSTVENWRNLGKTNEVE